jgi:hypothetical protein
MQYNRILSQRHDMYRDIFNAAEFISPNAFLENRMPSRKASMDLLQDSLDNAVKSGAVTLPDK